MKRNLVNFTRGSQLLGHFGFMFAAGLRGPVIVALLVIAGTSWWTLSSGLSDHESYLVWMRIYAAIYAFMEFDPAGRITLETAYGGIFHLPIAMLPAFPPVARAWAHLLDLERAALLRSALLLAPSFVGFYWFAARFGSRSKERQHERGAMLVTLPELVAEVTTHNARERARELTAGMGWRWRLCLPAELARVFPYRPAHLADVAYPWRLEQSHAMLIGTTGMGKTVALSDMIEEARERGQRSVVFDLTGSFIEHFYEPERDVILNPLDARCPRWSVFDECRDEAEFSAAAEALVPHDGGGTEQFWVLAARLLFVEMCLKLRDQGKVSNEALAQGLMTADLGQVHKLMRGTVADPLTAPEAARMAESIRAVFNANAKALKLLPRSGPRFSVRQWVEGGYPPGSMVFISARYIDMSVCSQLLTVWLDTAMNTLMAMDRTPELRLWFFIDELGALHRLPALEKGLQTARNFGGAIVTGIHAYAKLKEVYGENMAMTLSSLARTKLILGTADRETATWCSDFIGHRQVRDMEEGYTYGYNNARDAVSLTPRKHIEPLLLPDQLMNLPRLSGYLKFPDGFPAAPVRLTPRSRTRGAEPFIRRAADRVEVVPQVPPSGASRPAVPSSAGTAEHPSSNDDGAGRPVVPRQGELALDSSRGGAGSEDRQLAASRTRIAALEPSDKATEADSGTTNGAGQERVVVAGSTADQAIGQPSLPLAAVARSDVDGVETAPGSAVAGEPRSAELPVAKPGRSVTDNKLKSEPRREVEARRLMLEDGVPEPGANERDGPDWGDLDPDL